MTFWQDNMLQYELLAEDAAIFMDLAIESAVANRCRAITETLLQHTLMRPETADKLSGAGYEDIIGRIQRAAAQCLRDATVNHMHDTLYNLAFARTARGEMDYFCRDGWSASCAQALEDAYAQAQRPLTLLDIAACLCTPLCQEDNRDYAILNALMDLAAYARFIQNLSLHTDSTLFGADGALCDDCLSEGVSRILASALELASQRGVDRVQPTLLLKALLDDPRGFALQALEGAMHGEKRAVATILQLDRILQPASGVRYHTLLMQRDTFSPAVQAVLDGALLTARANGSDRMQVKWLLIELIESDDTLLRDVMANTLRVDIAAFQQAARALEEGTRRPLSLPASLCDCHELPAEPPTSLPRDTLENEILRALFDQRRPAVLLYGEAGVGRTTLAERIGQRVASNDVRFLQDFRAVYLDLGSIPSDQLASRCQSLLHWMLDQRHCLFIIGRVELFFTHQGGELRRALLAGKLPLLGITTEKERDSLLTTLDDPGHYFMQLLVPEPDATLTLQIAEQHRPAWEEELGVQFEEGLFARVHKLANDYLISRRNPFKLMGVLREAALEVAFYNAEPPAIVTKRDVAAQIAKITGLPTETILGTGEEKDYETMLGEQVKGQEMAVVKVASRLDMIQKSLVDKQLPPATFLFVGLSGTGKTELAKAIARVYSSSHTLITYAMENYKESHNVSGIIGTSQGYIGYEQGGKLINDLNRDPYATVLFDEVEKAHPAVWDPFLHLFGEGLITDLRGVTAYGNKAFFIMTSNIGYRKLCRMLRDGATQTEIEQAITQDIYATTHTSGEKCFRPEFINRILRLGGIIIFKPLSTEALSGIALHLAEKTQREWNQSRDVQLIIEPEVALEIARRVAEINQRDLENIYLPESGTRFGGASDVVAYKGGRIITSLFDDEVTGGLAKVLSSLGSTTQLRVMLDGGRVRIQPLGGDEVQAVERSRSDLLEQKLSRLMGRMARAEPQVYALPADAQETMLGAVTMMEQMWAQCRAPEKGG